MIINRVSAAIIAGLSVMGMTDPASALGFGRPTSRAILGEALAVTIPVRMDGSEDLTEECLGADVYFGDDKLSQTAVSVMLVPGSGNDRVVRVTTNSVINEPVVTVYLAAGCKAKVTRKFVAFADPPGVVLLASQVPDPASNPARVSASPVTDSSLNATALSSNAFSDQAGAPTEGRQSRRSKRVSEHHARQTARSGGHSARASTEAAAGGEAAGVGAQAMAAVTPAKPRKKDAAATSSKLSRDLSAKVDAHPPHAARLELDPIEADAGVAPSLMMTTGLAGAGADTPEIRERRAAAAALWAAMNASPEQLARDRQRMQDLEQRLQRLQQESAGAGEKVAAMEARVRQAEEHRLSHPLVYGLAAACGLLLLAVAWLFMRQRRQEEGQATWWQGAPEAADGADTAPALGEPSLDRTAAEFMPVRTDRAPALIAPPVPAEAPSSRFADAPPTTAAPVTRSISIKSEAQEAVREITVEELIDLEQQAEFFVVLGQDDAAIELLESHVQTTAGASPLPHLKLLEIYQRVGRRADYERVQTAFNGRFNAYAPSWESDLQQGHTLSEYPGVVERLQSLWSQPARAMEVLQVSLTRPDDSVETFDLPAYRELLFLYAVARDLSERDSQDRAPVDLVLPHSGELEQVDLVSPLMATRPVKAVPAATPSLSLDLSLDDPVPSVAGAVVEESITLHGNTIDFDLAEDHLSSPKA